MLVRPRQWRSVSPIRSQVRPANRGPVIPGRIRLEIRVVIVSALLLLPLTEGPILASASLDASKKFEARLINGTASVEAVLSSRTKPRGTETELLLTSDKRPTVRFLHYLSAEDSELRYRFEMPEGNWWLEWDASVIVLGNLGKLNSVEEAKRLDAEGAALTEIELTTSGGLSIQWTEGLDGPEARAQQDLIRGLQRALPIEIGPAPRATTSAVLTTWGFIQDEWDNLPFFRGPVVEDFLNLVLVAATEPRGDGRTRTVLPPPRALQHRPVP